MYNIIFCCPHINIQIWKGDLQCSLGSGFIFSVKLSSLITLIFPVFQTGPFSCSRNVCHICLGPCSHASFYIDIFRSVLGSKQNWAKSQIPRLPRTHASSLTINILQHSGTFVTISESTSTQHYHSKSTVSLKVHCWC